MSTEKSKNSEKPFVKILGVKIDLVDYNSVAILIRDCIEKRVYGKYICACPVHPIMASQRDLELRRALNNSWLTVPDGMPVVWAAKLLGAQINDRVYGPTLMLRSCQLAEKKGYSVFLYGATSKTLKSLQQRLLDRFPHLRIVGVHSPPFRQMTPTEISQDLEMINKTLPDLLFLGLGAPKQEKWMAKYCQNINVPVTIGVGAAFDFHARLKRQAPSCLQKIGLEWLFRLCVEPKRLWRRYLKNNPKFIWMMLLQMYGLRNYKMVRSIKK
jgi:N-acetylglucosaminyldiphosphoundecaprenol N-acetyl-beta-D-mannosaminyltransferase